MASRTGGVVQDQNLNINFPENNAGWKTNVTKAPKKGVFGGRTPLGDVSNKLNPSFNQAKKQNSNLSIFSKKDSCASKKTLDTTKKSTSNSRKVQTTGRKALSDISNSGNPNLNEESKKNSKAKLLGAEAIAEAGFLHDSKAKLLDPEAIAEEGFLHNHEECIKSHTRAMDLDYFLELTGLAPNNVISKQQENPVSIKLKPKSPPRYMELEEIAEEPFDYQSWKEELNNQSWKEELDSPTSWSSPISPRLFMDHDFEFKLLDSP